MSALKILKSASIVLWLLTLVFAGLSAFFPLETSNILFFVASFFLFFLIDIRVILHFYPSLKNRYGELKKFYHMSREGEKMSEVLPFRWLVRLILTCIAGFIIQAVAVQLLNSVPALCGKMSLNPFWQLIFLFASWIILPVMCFAMGAWGKKPFLTEEEHKAWISSPEYAEWKAANAFTKKRRRKGPDS